MIVPVFAPRVPASRPAVRAPRTPPSPARPPAAPKAAKAHVIRHTVSVAPHRRRPLNAPLVLIVIVVLVSAGTAIAFAR
ncbi:hypothetical protein [Actinomadura roseirufa]|uniref:hypothetical protein n=1 Tax=Actinomadura roseirufa TaxID=2094049 RepID=UPI0013F15136|nr:hypothetical protein [Actinomadura roseirufa]